jgi:TRAP-type C4-dicarboxylate transport system permease small subunit
MRWVGSVVDRINHFIGRAAMQVYLVVALLSIYEVFLRYVLNAPTTWSYEIILALCGLAWALSGGYVTLKRRHIAITVLYDIASPGVRRFLDIFALTFASVALGLLVYLSVDLALKSLRFFDKSGSAFNSPLPTLSKCFLVIGAILYLAQVVRELFRRIFEPASEDD